MFNKNREQAFAKTALALMGSVGVMATPENFELFYAYVTGENPAVAEAIDEILESKKPVSPELLADLRLRCLSGARVAVTMESLGGNITALITGMQDRLESSAREAADYMDMLAAATDELNAQHNPADLRKLADRLIAATRAMEQRAQSLEGELQASSQQVTELRSKLADVHKESLTDPLTHIANRKAFDDAMAAAHQAAAAGEAISLLICDVDNFKSFNDSWGHQTGDQVLRLVAACLSENVKGRDTAARYGGEEFAVLLRGTGLEDATLVADQIRSNVEAKKLVKKSTGGLLGTITISIGVAQLAPGETVEAVIRRADACLYGAKRAGRNLVVNQKDARIAALEASAA